MNDTGNRQPATGNGQSVDDVLRDLARMLDVRPSPDFGARVRLRVERPATADGHDVDGFLRDLSRTLDVTPSPDFSARVLGSVGREPVASSWWAWRWGFVAGATAAVALLAAFIQMRSQRPTVSERPTPTAVTVASPAIAPEPSGAPAPVALAASNHARQAPPRRETSMLAATALQTNQRIPQVLVAPDQAAAVRTILDRFARGSAPEMKPGGRAAGLLLQELEIDELAPIPPIVIPPLDAPPNAGGAGS